MKNNIAFSVALSLLAPLTGNAAVSSLPACPLRSHVRGVARVPLDRTHGMPVVEVNLGNSGPYRFAVDTSVKCSLIVDKSLAKSLSLPHRGIVDILNPATNEMTPYEIVSVNRVRIGDASFDGVNATVDDVRSAFKVDGLIGFGLLSKVVATLDYGNNELRLANGSLSLDDVSVQTLTMTDGVPAVVVQAGNRFMFANINNEVPLAMTVPANVARSLPIAEKHLTKELRAGTVSVANGRIAALDVFPLPTVGNEFLANAVVTFDAAHQRVAIGSPKPRT